MPSLICFARMDPHRRQNPRCDEKSISRKTYQR